MRLRRMDAYGDMLFGSGQIDFWRDQPEGVAQHVLTRLVLWTGQWAFDTNEGTPWQTEVLGERTRWTRDVMVRGRVLETPHVTEITGYSSLADPNTRDWAAAVAFNTDYGAVELRAARLPGVVPPLPPAPTNPPVLLLGVTGGADIEMVPADMTKGPVANVVDFTIRNLDPGAY